MNYKDAERVLEQIARENGVSRAEVEREIRAAIREAKNNPDPAVQRRWKALWPDGRTPGPAEFLAKMALLAQNGNAAFLH